MHTLLLKAKEIVLQPINGLKTEGWVNKYDGALRSCSNSKYIHTWHSSESFRADSSKVAHTSISRTMGQQCRPISDHLEYNTIRLFCCFRWYDKPFERIHSAPINLSKENAFPSLRFSGDKRVSRAVWKSSCPFFGNAFFFSARRICTKKSRASEAFAEKTVERAIARIIHWP